MSQGTRVLCFGLHVTMPLFDGCTVAMSGCGMCVRVVDAANTTCSPPPAVLAPQAQLLSNRLAEELAKVDVAKAMGWQEGLALEDHEGQDEGEEEEEDEEQAEQERLGERVLW